LTILGLLCSAAHRRTLLLDAPMMYGSCPSRGP
jgi:hypothetical protein